jgi:hypothetical protein
MGRSFDLFNDEWQPVETYTLAAFLNKSIFSIT